MYVSYRERLRKARISISEIYNTVRNVKRNTEFLVSAEYLRSDDVHINVITEKCNGKQEANFRKSIKITY